MEDFRRDLEKILPGFQEQPGDFEVRIEGRFESSHYLNGYYPGGESEAQHGHSWQVEVFLSRQDGSVGRDGIAIDFVRLRERLDALTGRLGHICINELPEFSGVNPTAENIARWFYRGLQPEVETVQGVVREIRVHEGPSNYTIFRPR